MATNQFGTRGHELKIPKERFRLDVRKYSFSQRVIEGWSRLPSKAVTAATVNSFKNAYDKYRKEMDDRS
jgi:ribonuclease P/MRP protein subunit RPP40